jgi:hypothetical protein
MQLSDNYLEKLHQNKELLVTSIVIFLCLFLSLFFPTTNAFQSASRSIFFLIILPILYIKLILKNDLAAWGWNLNDRKNGVALATVAFFSGLIIFYLLIRFFGFSSHYAINPILKNSFILFSLYELVFLNILFFTQEVFFKSFVLFSFKQLGSWTVLIQSATYLLLLEFSKSISWQTAPFIFISVAGGWITLKTRSFAYSYIFGLLFIIILDAYIIHLVK